MLLNESAFNEIKKVPDYTSYLCIYATKVHTKANGSCFDEYTFNLESVFLYLQKERKFKSLEEVYSYIEEVTEVKILESWMSPAFAEMFYYYCEKEDE